ncbi:MAG: hypothetical protein N2561_05375 [Bacteroidetes bacterium]|nr:hypothetical protein [Rhodothermia bacterium]MCX7906953.1 hypothetical protein [Bacteroidota bacterium]MDW8137683.1 hypothetical protein [Bacteroidota bacterium]MDW8285363.1 hypothetical protein [Bacteroidota bacterium]
MEDVVATALVFLVVAGTVWGGLLYFLSRLWREHDAESAAR